MRRSGRPPSQVEGPGISDEVRPPPPPLPPADTLLTLGLIVEGVGEKGARLHLHSNIRCCYLLVTSVVSGGGEGSGGDGDVGQGGGGVGSGGDVGQGGGAKGSDGDAKGFECDTRWWC